MNVNRKRRKVGGEGRERELQNRRRRSELLNDVLPFTVGCVPIGDWTVDLS